MSFGGRGWRNPSDGTRRRLHAVWRPVDARAVCYGARGRIRPTEVPNTTTSEIIGRTERNNGRPSSRNNNNNNSTKYDVRVQSHVYNVVVYNAPRYRSYRAYNSFFFR